jgi:hypothetical protein
MGSSEGQGKGSLGGGGIQNEWVAQRRKVRVSGREGVLKKL